MANQCHGPTSPRTGGNIGCGEETERRSQNAIETVTLIFAGGIMNTKTNLGTLSVIIVSALLSAAAGCTRTDTEAVTYDPDITTIMIARCAPCHLSVSASGGVILDTYTGVKEAVENTKLVNAINHNSGYSPMPQGADKLAQTDIDTIQTWIKNGSFETPPLDGVFIQPFTSCQGIEPGDNSSGDEMVCTKVAIAGSSEEGRAFIDYGSCDVVLTQRPYWNKRPYGDVDPNDERLSDEAFMQELNWINSQVRSDACVCCHDTKGSGRAAAVWDISAEGVWTDQLSDEGVAILAGKVSSDILGIFPPEQNNGFDRTSTGFPTTDVARVQAFFQNELDRRGVTDEDIASFPEFGSFILDIIEREPGACTGSEGIDADGGISWSGNDGARYIYVKEAGSENPGVPPNFDNPDGVLWRLDVMPNAEALSPGIMYGEVPEGTYQVTPDNGTAPALVSGQEYHLYILRDILVPICNCLFIAP